MITEFRLQELFCYVSVENYLTIINDSIRKFVHNMTYLNAGSFNTNNDSFIASIEENIFNRFNDNIPNDVIVKKTLQLRKRLEICKER